MRINPSVTPAVARTPETTTTTATAKPAAETKSAQGLVARDEFSHGIVAGGCCPGPRPTPLPIPLPRPMPPPFPGKLGDAQTRATQANQLDQISKGVANGSVTAQEAETLLKEQQNISSFQQKAMSDGKLSVEERLQLAVMQSKAALNVHQASNNGDRNLFAQFDQTAQRQAAQIGQIADGRRSGNITNYEAGHVLGDQVEIADARGDADTLGERLVLNSKLNKADRDIKNHSRPGTQLDIEVKPFPFPRPTPLPQPRPLPFPQLPRPLPLPEFPSKPNFPVLPFHKGVING